MTRALTRRAVLLAAAVVGLVAGPAVAQPEIPETGGRAYALVGGAFGDGTAVATGGGAGLRLTRTLGLDFEVAYLSGSDDSDDDFFIRRGRRGRRPSIFPPIGFDRERNITTFLTKFTVEFPVADGRLFPYITGGGGVGHVTPRVDLDFKPGLPIPFLEGTGLTRRSGDDSLGDLDFGRLTFAPSQFDQSEAGLSLSIGGGVDVRLWQGLGPRR